MKGSLKTIGRLANWKTGLQGALPVVAVVQARLEKDPWGFRTTTLCARVSAVSAMVHKVFWTRAGREKNDVPGWKQSRVLSGHSGSGQTTSQVREHTGLEELLSLQGKVHHFCDKARIGGCSAASKEKGGDEVFGPATKTGSEMKTADRISVLIELSHRSGLRTSASQHSNSEWLLEQE